MNLYAILALHSFQAPFTADLEQPGTVRDACRRPIPFLIVPGVLDVRARRIFSERVAELLNAQADEEVAERSAA